MKSEAEVIALAGFMGCGKSSTGVQLADILGVEFTDLDALIVQREGREIPQIFSLEGEKGFREAERRSLEWFLETHKGPAVLSLGGGTMTYKPSLDLVLERTISVYLRTSLPVIMERIGPVDPSRPLFASAPKLYEERKPLYERAAFTIDTDNNSPREVAEKIAKALPTTPPYTSLL